MGAVTVRLYGIYFALVTLAFAQMVFFIVEQAKQWTNGDDGLQNFPNALMPVGPWLIDLATPLPKLDLGLFGNLGDLRLWYIFAAVALLLVLLGTRMLVRSQFGEVLAGIRENEERASSIGFNPAVYRLAVFAISGALAGFAGAMRALYDGTVAVESLGLTAAASSSHGGRRRKPCSVGRWNRGDHVLENVCRETSAWRLIEGLVFVAVIVSCRPASSGRSRPTGRRRVLRRAFGSARPRESDR